MDRGLGVTEAGEATPVAVGTNLAEQSKLRVLEEQRRFRPDIYWYLSFRCNLACIHCSVESSPWVDTSDDLTPAECMKVVDQMAELNVRTAMLSGGEVLLRPDALDIMEALGQRGIVVGLETNGLRITPKFVELARRLQENNLLSMTISLDGGTKETHEQLRGPRSFDRTVRAFQMLDEGSVRFSVQCVLNNSNFQTISDLYERAESHAPSWQMVIFALLNPVGRGSELVQSLGLESEHIPRIFDLIQRHKPGYSGATMIKIPPAVVPPRYLPMVFQDREVKTSTSCQFPLLGVLPNGDVTICAVSRDNSELHFGNVRDAAHGGPRLREIWEKTRMSMLRSSYLSAEDLKGVCGDCVWKYGCKGACRAWAYEEGGSFGSPFPICKAVDDADAFPRAYRLSVQNAALVDAYRKMQVGCGCGV